jgi:hypothetical protein
MGMADGNLFEVFDKSGSHFDVMEVELRLVDVE